ncbi:hypothetical protein HY025_04310 [Candidatus Daviesbacteria bacterium]|nr:hypothetical protein [Candidatus Daviesbacteria bacterium]
MTYLDFLRIALLKASKIAKDYFGKTTSKLKKDNTVVTEADFAVGKFIIQEIEKAFPSYNIINEETGAVDNGSEFSFVIDPIDGTSNFSQGLPHYGVMLGLLKESEVINL